MKKNIKHGKSSSVCIGHKLTTNGLFSSGVFRETKRGKRKVTSSLSCWGKQITRMKGSSVANQDQCLIIIYLTIFLRDWKKASYLKGESTSFRRYYIHI